MGGGMVMVMDKLMAINFANAVVVVMAIVMDIYVFRT